MTREQFAQKMHWPLIIWFAGLVSVVAMAPQLIKIMVTWKVDDLSLPMFLLTFFVQASFSLEGYFKRNSVLMVCPGLAALVTGIITLLILAIR